MADLSGMAGVVELAGIEVDAAVLEGPGGPLPVVWQGRPLDGDVDDLPGDGWRLLPIGADGLPVYAAPAAGPGWWWLLHVVERDGELVRHGWGPEEVRPPRAARSAGLRLTWPASPLVVERVADVRVLLSRDGDPGLAWDDRDRSHVTGWVVDLDTGEDLPIEPWQAFGGPGPSVVPDETGAGPLAVRWVTRDIDALAPGTYGIRAQLLGLDVASPVGRLELLGPG